MKKTLFAIVILFSSIVSNTPFAQEIRACDTDLKRQEFFNSLSEQEKAQYIQERANYQQEIKTFIQEHPELQSSIHEKTIVYTIPVVFHIIHENGPENISYEQVVDAVEHMNKDYQKSNSNWMDVVPVFLPYVADIQIEFKLAKLDPNGNCTNGVTRTYSTQTNDGNANRVAIVKAAQGDWPGDKYLNIFVAKDIGGAAGYTQYPNNYLGSSMSNGIHVIHNYVGGIGTSSSTGIHTLSHEAGHWLDLPHAWGDSNEPGLAGNCSTDDGITDTPLCKGATTCNLNMNSCVEPPSSPYGYDVVDNVENFMEYAYCSKMFTLGQKARMHAALNSSVGGRNNIWKTTNLAATGVNAPDILCTAEFKSDYQEVCPGQPVTFQDLSYFGATSWNWEFAGGTPATSSIQNPTITYNTPGTYQVKLSVSDGSTNKSITKNAYIVVLDEGLALPFIEGFENQSFSDNFWMIENPGSNNKFETTNTTAYTGSKSIKLTNFGQPKANIDALVSQPIDLSSITNTTEVTLSFRYAYRKRQAANSEWLRVYISKDCGNAWEVRKTLKGNSLGNDIATSAWTPSSPSDWVTVHMINITSQFWIDNFRVKFEFESDGGNNFYMDDINIYAGDPQDDPLGIDTENANELNCMVYPNPTNKAANISFTLNHAQNVDIQLVNLAGQVISTDRIHASEGKNLVMMDVDNIQAGVYLIKVISGDTQVVKQLIIN
ncbi:MAG: M43 family zinc metalloprotease [Brumimicrobium sp.]|nr:M43 family zinc metalloprotease [Brumimicrobium sp.]